jgi:hypothetical protein
MTRGVLRHTPYYSILVFFMVGLLPHGSCTADQRTLVGLAELTEGTTRPASSVKRNIESGEKRSGNEEVSIQHLQPASQDLEVHSALRADRPNSFWRRQGKGSSWGNDDEERQLFSLPTRRLLQTSGRFLSCSLMSC